MKRSLLTASIAFSMVLSVARAAEPVSPDVLWSSAIETFAGVLDGSQGHEALDKLLSDHSWVAPFERNRTESVSVLPERLSGMKVVSARACMQPSVTSATDLVADLQADTTIAESIRKRLVPADGHDLRSADATMARWFSAALEAEPGDPVALIAMYDAGHTADVGTLAVQPSLTLLLIRGEIPAGGTPRISRVLYGTLDSAVH